jgi:hypothetical protein
MIDQPDVQVLVSLTRLRGDTDFDRVLTWLRAEHEKAARQCEEQSEDLPLRRCQGSALTLRSLLEIADTAPDLADRIRRNAR